MTDAYLQHPIRELLTRFSDLEHENALFDPDISANHTVAHGRDKVFAFVKLIKDQLNATPALYASVHLLSQLQSSLQNIYNEFTAYISNRNIGHLNNAAAYVDQSLIPLYGAFAWYSAPPASKDTSGSAAIDTLERRTNEVLSRLHVQQKALEATLSGARSALDQQGKRLEEMSITIATQKADAASVVATVTKSYAEFEAKSSADFLAQVNSMDQNFASTVNAADKKAAELLALLTQHKSDAERIVQVVGNIGVTGNYQRIADNENLQANIWRRLTLAFFGLGVALAFLTFCKFYFEPVHPDTTLTVVIRLLFALAITAPAWYTAKESARHRTNSDRARQTELELASLGPFIELMPPETKNSIREELSKKYFGNQVEEHQSEPPLITKDLINVAIEAIKALKR